MLTNVAEPSVVDRPSTITNKNMVTEKTATSQKPTSLAPASPSRSAASAYVVARRRIDAERIDAERRNAELRGAEPSDKELNPEFLGSQRFKMPDTPAPTIPSSEPPQEAVTEKDLVQVFKLLADETRLKILLSLQREGELHVSALCDRLNQSQPAVSHHLALLRDSGLIRPRRDGKHNYYSVRREHFEKVMGGLFDSMLDPQPAAE